MKKRTKIIIVVSILLVIVIIGIFCLAVYLDKKIGVNIVTVVNTYDNRMVYAAVATERGINYPLNDVIIKDLNLNEMDESNVQIGNYIYLYINEDNTGFYCNSTNYYCRVESINENSIYVKIPEFSFYSLNAEEINIKDINGKKISVSDLKFGDNIKVVNIWPDVIPAVAETYQGYSSNRIYDVKKIMIVEPNQETIEKLENRNMMAIKNAVIVGVNENSLYVVDSENKDLLYEVSFTNEGNIGFEQGQEVTIYFNGKVGSSDIKGVSAIEYVGKIEIKDGNKQLISNDVLKRFYTSFDNVNINIDNLTNTGLKLTVTDNNNIKYEFENKFYLSKNVAEKSEQTAVEKDNGSIIIFPGKGDEWQELSKISNDVENTGTAELVDENATRWTIDWSNIYGTLGSGEYRFVLGNAGDNPNDFTTNGYDKEIISVKFTIDDNGQVVDDEVNKGY